MDRKKLFKPYKGNDPYIFVSYRHDDSDTVFAIISDFHRRGYRIWYDNGISVGDDFVKELASRIIDCNICFCFLSPRYFTSDYCKREMDYALKKHKTIFPIMIEDFELPNEIDFQLASINRTKLSEFASEEEMVDYLCEISEEKLRPCHVDTPLKDQADERKSEKRELEKQEPEKRESEKQEPKKQEPEKQEANKQTSKKQAAEKPPSGSKRLFLALGIALLAAVIVLAVVFLPGRGQGEPSVSAPPQVTAGQEESVPPSTAPAPSEAPAETAAPSPSAAPAVSVKPELLASSGQKALKWLTGCVGENCPLSVYDPPSSEASDDVYDNSVAALALLANSVKNKNHNDSALTQVLDSLAERTENGSLFASASKTKSLSAAALALLQADREKSSFRYARAAQKILDRVLETAVSPAGGFCRDSSSQSRSTADQFWLYAAFSLLRDRTGINTYAEAAKNAEAFVQSMRAQDGGFYLAGDDAADDGLLSAEAQALAVLVMNDRTGISSAAEQCASNGGFAPDNRSSGGFSSESTLLMALAFDSLGMEEESRLALSAVYPYQRENGSIPEASAAALTDGRGDTQTNLPRTSATGWYALATAGTNPFATGK